MRTGEPVAARGWILIVGGPHGAGKDFLADALTRRSPSVRRITRVTTRAIDRAERDLGHYQGLTTSEFAQLEASGEILVARHYPEASTGIPLSQLDQPESGGVRIVTCNFDEGVELAGVTPSLGYDPRLIFVSPVNASRLRTSEDEYLGELSQRMRQRARPSDDIQARVRVAARYRQQLLDGRGPTWTIVSNEFNRQNSAIEELAEIAAALSTTTSA